MEPQLFLIRHGETEWSREGRHTGRTDIPLSAEGRLRAEAIGRVLRGRRLTVWTSPLERARETCRLAGFADSAKVDDDLREWDYGIYEGLTTPEIRRTDPGWSVWLSPIVGGESLEQVADRARRVVGRALAAGDSAGRRTRPTPSATRALPSSVARPVVTATGRALVVAVPCS